MYMYMYMHAAASSVTCAMMHNSQHSLMKVIIQLLVDYGHYMYMYMYVLMTQHHGNGLLNLSTENYADWLQVIITSNIFFCSVSIRGAVSLFSAHLTTAFHDVKELLWAVWTHLSQCLEVHSKLLQQEREREEEGGGRERKRD